MARPKLTDAQRIHNIDDDATSAAYACTVIRKATAILDRPLSDVDVCDCPEGNGEGITEAECGCRHRKAAEQIAEAARMLEAVGCRARRNVAALDLPA